MANLKTLKSHHVLKKLVGASVITRSEAAAIDMVMASLHGKKCGYAYQASIWSTDKNNLRRRLQNIDFGKKHLYIGFNRSQNFWCYKYFLGASDKRILKAPHDNILDLIEAQVRFFAERGVISTSTASTIYMVYSLNMGIDVRIKDLQARFGASKRVSGHIESAGISREYYADIRRKKFVLPKNLIFRCIEVMVDAIESAKTLIERVCVYGGKFKSRKKSYKKYVRRPTKKIWDMPMQESSLWA